LISTEEQANLLALAPHETSPALVGARHELIGEELLAENAYHVWNEARTLPPAERYRRLADWVLPSDSHPTLRLQADFTPADLQHAGGELASPALELVRTAAELNKLDELSAAIERAASQLPDEARPIAALEALVAIARQDDATVAAKLRKCLEFVKQQPADTPLYQRWPEYVAARAALTRPKLAQQVSLLAEQLVLDQEAAAERHVSDAWDRRVRHLAALARWQNDPATAGYPFGQAPPASQWMPASRATAQSRGLGFAPAAWKRSPGEVEFLAGNGRDMLYFNTPLRGDFEVRCQVAVPAGRGIYPLYAGLGVELLRGSRPFTRHELGGTSVALQTADKVKELGEWVDYRLVVAASTLTVFVNDQQIDSQRLPEQVDPWLAIQSAAIQARGAIRNLRILGSPIVPKEIHLSAGLDLIGWDAAYYAETLEGDSAAWSKTDDEIVGRQRVNSPGSVRQSLLRYHRPLLEDGELEYEFFYEPGKTEVHPALDRLVFLLKPEGVQIHWLTDAQYDRTSLPPDNATPLAGSTPPQLVSSGWNKLQLMLAEDEVTIVVNGQQVARSKLGPTNQRSFGLFRYTDIGTARFRNVVYRGAWPTKLPPLAEQELAAR
jgi:hypothetical protein